MIKTLAAYIGEYKKDSIKTPIFIVLEVLMEILIPFVTANIIDKGIQAGNMTNVYLYGGIMLVLAFISLFCGIQAGKCAASASTGFACNLREGIYTNVQNFAFSNIDKYSTAGLITRMTTDITNVQNAYQMIIRIAVRAPLMMICSMIMCFIINPRMSMIFLGALIFLGFVLFFIIFKVTPIFSEGFAKYDDLNASVQENVSGIRVVKAFVREDYENRKFAKAADNLYSIFVRAESWLAFNNPVMMIVIYGSIIALSWFAAHFIVGGSMTTGNLTSMFSYVLSMMMSLMMLSMIFVMVSMSTASARRIADVLNEKADITNPDNPIMEVADGRVDFNHVNFAYKKDSEADALHDIDIHINAGETIGIIGGTGCGKSSFVNLISRLYDVKDGAVLVGGRDVR
ncbi:MAG: ABC transporter ATP-binding protein, partial [Lachnospira sp.]